MKFSVSTTLITFFSILVLGAQASAEPAYARTCRISGGQYWAVSMNSRFDTPLCVFGMAAIGAGDFAEYKWGQNTAHSLRSFLKQRSSLPTNGVCDLVGAAYRTATDSEGGSWGLCRFVDGSVIEIHTLARGMNNSQNQGLVNALK